MMRRLCYFEGKSSSSITNLQASLSVYVTAAGRQNDFSHAKRIEREEERNKKGRKLSLRYIRVVFNTERAESVSIIDEKSGRARSLRFHKSQRESNRDNEIVLFLFFFSERGHFIFFLLSQFSHN